MLNLNQHQFVPRRLFVPIQLISPPHRSINMFVSEVWSHISSKKNLFTPVFFTGHKINKKYNHTPSEFDSLRGLWALSWKSPLLLSVFCRNVHIWHLFWWLGRVSQEANGFVIIKHGEQFQQSARIYSKWQTFEAFPAVLATTICFSISSFIGEALQC